MKKLVLSVTMIATLATPLYAAHNNPWATDVDVVLGKKHDANQAKSIGTPGQDEMRGEMRQDTDPSVGHGPQGHGGGGQASGGKGGGTDQGGGAGQGGGKGGGGHGGGQGKGRG